MSALYPLRMNSKYQTKIEQLESMGFDANEAAQHLEEHEGNVLRAIEQLLQDKAEEEDEIESSDEEVSGCEEENDQSEGEPHNPIDPHSISIPQDLNTFFQDLNDSIQLKWGRFSSSFETYWNPILVREVLIPLSLIIILASHFIYCHLTRADYITKTFTTVYDFEDQILFGDEDVVMKHIYHYDAYLHAISDMAVSKPLVESYWRVIRVQNEDDGKNVVKLMYNDTGKYLRINKKSEVDVKGNGGSLTLFEVTVVEANSHNFKGVRLESVKYAGKYIAMRANGDVMVTEDCDNDIDCVLIFMTTQRSHALMNKKYEWKIAELQQEIESLKANACKVDDPPHYWNEADLY